MHSKLINQVGTHFELHHASLPTSAEKSIRYTITVNTNRFGRGIGSPLFAFKGEHFTLVYIINLIHRTATRSCKPYRLSCSRTCNRKLQLLDLKLRELSGRPFKQTRQSDIKYHESLVNIVVGKLELSIDVGVSKNGASNRSQTSAVQKRETKVACNTYSASL